MSRGGRSISRFPEPLALSPEPSALSRLEAPAPFSSIAIIGPGLLGGSILKAARARIPDCDLRIWARRREALEDEEVARLADLADTDIGKVVRGAELVILAIPVHTMFAVVATFGELTPGTIVTDVGSTKLSVVSSLSGPVSDLGGVFVGSHPMAGSEKTGINYAVPDLFEDAAVVITPESTTDGEVVERLHAFWEALGGRVFRLTPIRHDEVVSSISHLPHLVASALARTALHGADPVHADLSGGGLRDTTRVAAGDPDMWTEIMLANQEALLGDLEKMIGELERWRQALATLDKEALNRFLCESKRCRELI